MGNMTFTKKDRLLQNIIGSQPTHTPTDAIYIDFEKVFDRIDHN